MKGGKNYYVELFGEILAITKMANSGLDRGDSAAGPPGRDNLNLNIPYYSCIARSYYMHIYLAPKKVEKK